MQRKSTVLIIDEITCGYGAAGVLRDLRRTSTRSGSALRHKPPRYGQHAREILAEAGFSEAESDALLAEGAVLEERRR